MSYYDHKWQPWRTRGKATSVASMAVWERPRKWNTSQAIRAEAYASLRVTQSCRVLLDVDPWDISSRIMPDKSRIVWSVIDSTPALTWLAFTRHPHLIANGWPPNAGHHDDMGGDGQTYSAYRPNVWLGVDVSTQRESEELIPALLKCRELCGRLVVRVTVTELIRLHRLANGWGETYDALKAMVRLPGGRQFATSDTKPIDWLILQGDVGRKAKPCYLAHVRELVRQAREAGVPCWVERLGSRVHEPQTDVHGRDIVGSVRTWVPNDKHGADPSEWPEDLRAREVPK